jgi:hypothetical protein
LGLLGYLERYHLNLLRKNFHFLISIKEKFGGKQGRKEENKGKILRAN